MCVPPNSVNIRRYSRLIQETISHRWCLSVPANSIFYWPLRNTMLGRASQEDQNMGYCWGIGFNPPRGNVVAEKINFHLVKATFFGFKYKPLACKALRTHRMSRVWFVTVFNHITTSSTNMWQISPIKWRSAAVTRRWCIGGKFRNPIGITIHSYNPNGVITAVFQISSGFIKVWKNKFVMSSVDHTIPCVQSAKILSTRGSGKVSKTVLLFKMW